MRKQNAGVGNGDGDESNLIAVLSKPVDAMKFE